MILLLAGLVALSGSDFDNLDRAVAACRTDEATPAFAAESARRNDFLTAAYKEQEAIVADRLDISDKRRLLREKKTAEAGTTNAELDLRWAANDDRQRALNDNRMLEALRNDAMNAKRSYFLAHCVTGKR